APRSRPVRAGPGHRCRRADLGARRRLTPRPPHGCGAAGTRSAYAPRMSEQWRVRLIQPASGSPVPAKELRDLLRSRVGKKVDVSKAKDGVFFLSVATGPDAVAAQDTARALLTELDLPTDSRLERWDAGREAWVVAAGPVAGVTPGAPESDRERSRRLFA